jgi:hypothetical protein
VKNGPDAGRLTDAYGGIWDQDANRGAGDYIGFYDATGRWTGAGPEPTADMANVVEVAEQQLPFIRDFGHHIVLAEGARRSGKSFAIAPKVLLSAISFPHTKGVLLGPTYRQIGNVWNHILKITPRHWLLPGTRGKNKTDKTLRFINGAEVVLLHAYKDDASRSEGCAWGGYDERQDISDEAAANALLSTSEGGDHFHIFETATIKQSLRDHHDKLEANPECKIYRMVGRGNPFISHKLFDFAAGFLDSAAVKREIDAVWPDLIGRIYYPFDASPGAHVRGYPLMSVGKQPMEDITAAVNSERFAAFDAPDIISIDPPHHAVVYRIYRGDILHAIDEVIVGQDGLKADVRDLAQACKARGYRGIAIRDPHDSTTGGKGVHDCDKYFRAAGYRTKHMQYVKVDLRLTSMRNLMERNRYFVDPRCAHLIETLKKQTYKLNTNGTSTGKPDKTQPSKITPHFTMDHIGDAAGYAPYKLFPSAVDYEAKEEAA